MNRWMADADIYGRCFSTRLNLFDISSGDWSSMRFFSMNFRSSLLETILFPICLCFRIRTYERCFAYRASYFLPFLFLFSSYQMALFPRLCVLAISTIEYPFSFNISISLRSEFEIRIHFFFFSLTNHTPIVQISKTSCLKYVENKRFNCLWAYRHESFYELWHRYVPNRQNSKIRKNENTLDSYRPRSDHSPLERGGPGGPFPVDHGGFPDQHYEIQG